MTGSIVLKSWHEVLALTSVTWNCDKTGLCTAAGAKSLLVKRGSRQVSEVSNDSDHEYITIHRACCASGEQLPPFIIYKGKKHVSQVDGWWSSRTTLQHQ